MKQKLITKEEYNYKKVNGFKPLKSTSFLCVNLHFFETIVLFVAIVTNDIVLFPGIILHINTNYQILYFSHLRTNGVELTLWQKDY